jgi:hypothetical protein
MEKRRRRLGIALLATVATLAGCDLLSPPTTARFDIEPPVLYAGEPVRLDGGPSIGESAIVDFAWDLGNGESASGREVTVTYGAPGSYVVALTVENASGRKSTTTKDITVYVRGGTQIFHEDFSRGPEALGRWALDPTWASVNESRIEFIAGAPGYTLFIDTGGDRWHRRYTAVSFPPLRVGQRLVFTCRAMTLENQDAHTFIIVPGRHEIPSTTGSLPYYEFTSNGGGSYTREPTTYGPGVGHPVGFTPQIYRWHTYSFVYGEDEYELWIDGILWQTGPVSVDLTDGGEWFVLLGEESSAEACSVYYDDIRVSVEE